MEVIEVIPALLAGFHFVKNDKSGLKTRPDEINHFRPFLVRPNMAKNGLISLFSAGSISALDPRRAGGFFQPLLPDGVMAAQVTLTHLVLVRIQVGQPFGKI